MSIQCTKFSLACISSRTIGLSGLIILLFTGCSSLPSREITGEQHRQPAFAENGTNLVTPAPEIATRAVSLFNEANSALEEEHYELAELRLKTLVSEFPNFSSPHTNLGILYAHTARIDSALESFHRAVELAPGDCAPLVMIGLLERQRRAFDIAEKYYLACIVADSSYAPAHLNLGILYELYLGRLPEALTAYEHYQTLAPDKRVARWITDLSRRVGTEKQLASGIPVR